MGICQGNPFEIKRRGFWFQSFMLELALCAATFEAGLAYGANRIRVGFGKVLFLNGICGVCLGLTMTSGFLLQRGFWASTSGSLRRKPYFYDIFSPH